MFLLILCFLFSKTLSIHSTFPEVLNWFSHHAIIAFFVAWNLLEDIFILGKTVLSGLVEVFSKR